MIMNVCQYNYRQKIVNIAINNQNINSNITKNLIDYLSQQNNYLINNNLIRDLQNNYQEFLNIYCKKTKFDSAYDFVNSTFTNIIFVAIIVIGAYLVINQSQQFNIGRLTFVISLLSMMHNATNGICDFIVKQITFKKMQEIYLGVVETSNVNNTGQTKIMQIQQIHYQLHNHKRCITNGELLNKQQYKIINNLINYRNNNIYINEIPLDKIDYQDIHNKIFGINLFTKIDKKLIIEQVEKRNLLLIQIIQRFKIDIISQPSLTLTQQLLLNIGFCGGLTNNLILFDNCLSYLSVCEKKWIKKNIIPELIKNNFVLINRT
jgi:hypothetical protein